MGISKKGGFQVVSNNNCLTLKTVVIIISNRWYVCLTMCLNKKKFKMQKVKFLHQLPAGTSMIGSATIRSRPKVTSPSEKPIISKGFTTKSDLGDDLTFLLHFFFNHFIAINAFVENLFFFRF